MSAFDCLMSSKSIYCWVRIGNRIEIAKKSNDGYWLSSFSQYEGFFAIDEFRDLGYSEVCLIAMVDVTHDG